MTDDVARAQARMLEALCAIPADVPVTGWVTVMVYVPSLNGYDRFQTPVRVMRTESGEVQWLAGGGGE